MSIDFSKLISMNKNWFDKEFTHHNTTRVSNKLQMRLYTVKPSGTTINFNSLANALLDIIPHYYKPKSEVNKQIQKEIENTRDDFPDYSCEEHREEVVKKISVINYREATKFFKKKSSTSKSGKYGELLLFGIVESVLDCKMIAHKITNLTNYHDEIKGGDGIFLGEYKTISGISPAYLIGESKVWKNFVNAKKDALDSINRFHDPKVQTTFNTMEFFIAIKDIEKNIEDNINIDELYDRLNPKSELFKKQIAVHPIMIMYDLKIFESLMKEANTHDEFNNLTKKYFESQLSDISLKLSEKIGDYPNLEKVFLDFILIPVDKVESFNNAMDSLI